MLQENIFLEALHCDTNAPCIVQWKMLWYSAPTGLDKDLLNDVAIFEKYNKVINMAVETPFMFLSHKHSRQESGS